MDSTFRSLPLSIIDFFAAVVPGLAWLLLIVTTTQLILNPATVTTPLDAFHSLMSSVAAAEAWFSPVSALLVAFAIGHAIEPVAMPASQEVAVWLFRLHKEYRRSPVATLRFPFSAIHETHEYYAQVEEHVRRITNLRANELPPGRQPFSAAKRLLRLECAPLWEEAEHMEAEVRLIGGLFLAALFSGTLAVGALVRSRVLHLAPWRAVVWLGASIIAAFVLGESFNRARVREVGYTYLNLILAISRTRNPLVPTELISSPATESKMK